MGDRVAEDAVWSYRRLNEQVGWLSGHVGVSWSAMDSWFDEDEEVFGEIRDPYHRVDIRHTSRHVCVTAAGVEIAETRRALLVSETGLPNRFYIPADDVRSDILRPSATHTICPYKGTASYRTLQLSDKVVEDAAWFYDDPLPETRQIAGYLCFLGDEMRTSVDGAVIDS